MIEQYKLLCQIIYKTSKNELVELDVAKVNFKEIIRLAFLHNVNNIVYYAIVNNKWQDYIEKDILLELKQQLFLSYTLHLDQLKAIDDLIDLAEANEKPIVLFKGSINKELYYKPEMRVMSDIDFLPIDSKFYGDYLLKKGFQCFASSKLEDAYQKENLVIELHFALDLKNNLEDFNKYLISYKNYNYVNVLSNEFYLIYLLDHALKHFKHGGFGVKILLDLVLFCENNEFEISLIKYLTKEYKLYNFTLLVNELIKIFFELELFNIENEIYSKEDLDNIVDMFVNGGEYGKNNDSLSFCYASGDYSYFKFIFINTNELYRKIPICNKYKILIPIGYILNFIGETLRAIGLYKPHKINRKLIKKYRKIFKKILKA